MMKRIAFLPLLCLIFSCSTPTAPTMRERILQYMVDMAAIKWSPKEDIHYYSGEDDKVFAKGKEYIGLPYTMGNGRTVTLGDPLGGFRSKLDEDGHTYIGPTGPNEYYGSDCSSSVEGAWHSVGLITNAIYTGAMIPGENKNIYAVGDYLYSERSAMTKSICSSNTKETMYTSYAKLQVGDALVRRVPSGDGYVGHVRLVREVQPEAKKVITIEQCGYGIDGWTTTTWRVSSAYSFEQLFSNFYIPITPIQNG